MSRRNFILLMIITGAILVTALGFLYFRSGSPAATGNESEGTNFLSQFNPFKNEKPSDTPNTPQSVEGLPPETSSSGESSKLVRVSSMPVAGFGLFPKERFKSVAISAMMPTVSEQAKPETVANASPLSPSTEFATAVRYVDKATGNIYQSFADKIEERKFSGTIIPKIYDAYFGNKGESVVMRYLKGDGKTIETFVGTLPKEHLGGDSTGDNTIVGSFLPDNVKDISVSPDGLKIFYLFNSGESSIGATLSFPDGKKTQVFDSPFTEWLSSWGDSQKIILSTKPSAGVPGYMYALNLASKNLSKMLGNINGLTALASPNGKLILYGRSDMSLDTYNTETGNSTRLSVSTLPEKCVWNKSGSTVYCAVPKFAGVALYPDAWYQGEESFDDDLWKINTENGSASLILDPVEVFGEYIDGIKLALDENENYLFLINKKDSTLWRLDLMPN